VLIKRTDPWSGRTNRADRGQIGGHAGARHASDALRAAYNELMARYPNEGPTNRDAFFDYHCALDFL
jgi:hypothetical protein